MQTTEQRVLDAIDVEGMLTYLCELVAIPSLGGQETAAQEHVAAQMKRCGLAVDVWELDFDQLRQHPPQVEWWGGQFEPDCISVDHPIVETVSAAYVDVSGTPARVEGAPYGADMRLLVSKGQTPTVLLGPGDVRNAHRPDEYVPVAELVAATRTLALTALCFSGG